MTAADSRQRFKSILCPIDFSEHSRLALRYASRVALKSRGRLTVLFVNDPLLHAAAAAAAYDIDVMAKNTKRELTGFVRASLPGAARRRRPAICEEALGRPSREIMKRARKGRFDLIVIGTQGLRGARKLFFGSTTAGVLRDTRVPVLAVPPVGRGRDATRPPRSWPGRQVIVPTDLGRSAPSDIRRSIAMARWFGATVLLVHVVHVVPPPPWYRADLKTELRIRIGKARAELEALQLSAPEAISQVIVVAGNPADEIAALAAERRAGLVILASRSRSRVFGAPAGSIAYRVLCHATAPVLALPRGQ